MTPNPILAAQADEAERRLKAALAELEAVIAAHEAVCPGNGQRCYGFRTAVLRALAKILLPGIPFDVEFADGKLPEQMPNLPLANAHCPHCGGEFEGAAGPFEADAAQMEQVRDGRWTPRPSGQLPVCVCPRCAGILMVDPGFKLRKPTTEEFTRLQRSPMWPRVQIVLNEVRRRWVEAATTPENTPTTPT